MNFETMTEKLQQILIKALTICKDNQNPEIGDEHLIKAFLEDDDICSILEKLNTKVNPLVNYTNEMIEKLPTNNSNSEPSLGRYVVSSYNEANTLSKNKGDKFLGALDVFVCELFNESLFCKNLRKLIIFIILIINHCITPFIINRIYKLFFIKIN